MGKSPRRIVKIGPEDTIAAAARKMSRHGIGCLVVTDPFGKLVGILSERDIISRVLSRPKSSTRRRVKDVMTRRVVSCSGDTPMSEVQSIMSRRGIRHVPVVEGGLPVGMISAREVMAEQCDTDRAMRDLTIYALARLSESRDPETGHHLDRVRSYALELCRQMRRQRRHAAEITEDFMQLMYATSPLHDIGKVSIPDCVLLKPGRLDEAEFEVMKTHARVGAETLGLALTRFPGASFLRMAKAIAGYHHERFDGQGYPEGLRGADIPLSARIFAVADVYDALVSRRVYKDAFTHQIARSIVVQGGGTQFDPDVVRAFLRCDERFQEIRRQYDIAQAA